MPAKVTTEAIVDNLLDLLPVDRNKLVLFDINRNVAVTSTLLIDDPGPFTRGLMEDPQLPFRLTLVNNRSPEKVNVVVRRKGANMTAMSESKQLDFKWPQGVVSLSHVALPILGRRTLVRYSASLNAWPHLPRKSGHKKRARIVKAIRNLATAPALQSVVWFP